MTKSLLLVSMLLLSLGRGHGAETAKGPSFEVASITPCKPGTPEPPGEHAAMVQFTYPGGRFTARATTVKFLLEWAYGIQPSQHTGGPNWLGVDRYDIMAKAEGNPSDAEMKRMAQTLLADWFKLRFHRETKAAEAIVLTVGKASPGCILPRTAKLNHCTWSRRRARIRR